MSEQIDLKPLYIVVNSFKTYGIAMRQSDGSYAKVLGMLVPYDNAEAALKVCEALMTLEVELKAAKAKTRKTRFIGVSP